MVETPSRGGIVMKAWRLGGGLLLALLLIAGHTAAQPGYRLVDEHGNVHYVGRRDQVPERYRDQLTLERRGEPPRPTLAPSAPPSAGGPVTGECILRFRGTERRRGSSQSFPSCEACWQPLAAMRGEDDDSAECVATSVESYR